MKKRFSNRYSQFRNNNRFRQYVLKYEDEEDENNNHEKMIQYFEKMTLSISENAYLTNAFLNDFELDELFLTSLEKLNNIEFIFNTFANKTFEHRLIAKNDITSAITIELVSYNYTSSSNSRTRRNDVD